MVESNHKRDKNNQFIDKPSSSKSIISKELFCDEDFDKLVIDTSHRVSNDQLQYSSNELKSFEFKTTNSSDGDNNSIKLSKSNSNSIISTHSPNSDQNTTTQDSFDNFDNCNTKFQIANGDQQQQQQQQHKRSYSHQPKRPMNAFMVWGQAIRRNLHLRFSNVQNASLSKALGRVWRSLDPAEKEPYVKKANIIKENHKRDYPNYRYQPRRIQERRNKNNLLIGIHLNHPVNEYPRRATSFSSTQIIDNDNNNNNFNYDIATNNQLLNKQSIKNNNNNNNNSDSISINANNLTTTTTTYHTNHNPTTNCNELFVKEGKHIDGVQTFEYQPYPLSSETQLNNSLSFNGLNNNNYVRNFNIDNDNNNINNNLSGSSLDYNNKTIQHQVINTSYYSYHPQLTPTTISCQSSFTNNIDNNNQMLPDHNHHHHHHHQQQQQHEQFIDNNNQSQFLINSANSTNDYLNVTSVVDDLNRQQSVNYYGQTSSYSSNTNSSHQNDQQNQLKLDCYHTNYHNQLQHNDSREHLTRIYEDNHLNNNNNESI